MTDKRTLSEFIELAAERRKVNSGRKLAEIAQAAGHDISHSTVNRIRKGDYPSAPTTAILKAIAFLAREPESAVFAVAPRSSSRAEIEALVGTYLGLHENTRIIIDRYSLARGLPPEAAEAELQSLIPYRNEFFHRTPDWVPPWDPAAGSGGLLREAEDHLATTHQLPSAARRHAEESEGRRRREDQDRDAELAGVDTSEGDGADGDTAIKLVSDNTETVDPHLTRIVDTGKRVTKRRTK